MLGYILSLCAVAVIMLGAALLPRWLGLGPELRRLRQRKQAMQKMQQAFGHRITMRKRDLAAAAGVANRVESRRRELMHERVLAQGATASAIRLIEPENRRRGSEVWMAKVVNRQSDSMTPKPGGAFFFDHCWAVPQTILVIATNPGDARESIEKAFPDSLGFNVINVDRAPIHLAVLVDSSAGQDPRAA